MTPRVQGESRRSIVVGFDGSDASRSALDRAARLAASGGRVTVVSASPLLVHVGRSEDEGGGESAPAALLEEAARVLGGLGVDHEEVTSPLEPADALVEIARRRGAETVVVGTRGRGRAARTALGSVSSAVLRYAPYDVLVVRPTAVGAGAGHEWPHGVVVGYDASPWARRALERAAEIVRPTGTVHVVTVTVAPRWRRAAAAAPTAALREACDRLGDRGLAFSVHEAQGDPATVIIETALECRADLVAVGSRSRGQAARLILGSVSSVVVHRAEQDVLVVRQRQ